MGDARGHYDRARVVVSLIVSECNRVIRQNLPQEFLIHHENDK